MMGCSYGKLTLWEQFRTLFHCLYIEAFNKALIMACMINLAHLPLSQHAKPPTNVYRLNPLSINPSQIPSPPLTNLLMRRIFHRSLRITRKRIMLMLLAHILGMRLSRSCIDLAGFGSGDLFVGLFLGLWGLAAGVWGRHFDEVAG